MRIPPVYEITPEILELIAKIEANRIFLQSFPIPYGVRDRIQRVSLLKSSLFSARIEGNPLTLADWETTSERQKKLEVSNILAAIRFIGDNIRPHEDISAETILDLHKVVMKGLSPSSGVFRKEMGAIFNQAGIAIYVCPPPSQISQLIEKLLEYINTSEEKLPLLTAFLSHLVFEKIHPFLDGNGRVGRLLIFAVLQSHNWQTSVFVPVEEYFDEHKDDYYYHLDTGLSKTQEYLLFMMRAFCQQIEKIKAEIVSLSGESETILLPPRQEEIYYIVKDHNRVTFDFISRRFIKVPKRTLRYDLKKLQEKGLITKIGETRGSCYVVHAKQIQTGYNKIKEYE